MAVVAEWLRRWTRNPLGSARAGSNPADCAYFKAICVQTMWLELFMYPKNSEQALLVHMVCMAEP